MAVVGRRIGVIGGGQLAWMMGPAAKKLGLELIVQTPQPTDPAVAIAADTVLAPVDDALGTATLARRCDLITFENEFIDLPALQALAQEGVTFYPSLDVLAPVLDKGHQRQFFADHGLPNPPFVSLEAQDLEALAGAAQALGWPLVLKTRRLGYDGYGTFIVPDLATLKTTWESIGHQPIILEAFIPFSKELAVMVARSQDGDIAVYPTVETQQIDQVCRRVIAPTAVDAAVDAQVKQIARTLVSQLQVVGIIGIEFFLTADQRVLINEIAPRTHNSGHYTLDACTTSQFEQQLRAVSGHPLGPVSLTCDRAVMVNLLGFETATHDYPDQRSRLAQIPHAHLYWYGKTQSRPGRKLGHVTLCLDATADLDQAIHAVETIWYGKSTAPSTYSLSQLNQMTQTDFTAALGAVFEDTPSIAAQVWKQRPFNSIESLHQTMVTIVQGLSPEEQHQLICAHPDLGSRARMAEASVQEQAGAGLDQLTPEAHAELLSLNQRYRAKFDFPFIVAVAGKNAASILEELRQRLNNDLVAEQICALTEIYKIAGNRLQDWVARDHS